MIRSSIPAILLLFLPGCGLFGVAYACREGRVERRFTGGQCLAVDDEKCDLYPVDD